MNTIEFTSELDCRGECCAVPILKAKKRIDSLQKDEILKLTTTDAGSPKNMASWAKQTGNVILSASEQEGEFIFFIQKK